MTVPQAPAQEDAPGAPRSVWTAEEAADYLRLNRRTLLKMAERGEIPSLRLGKLRRFDRAKIVSMFDDGRGR